MFSSSMADLLRCMRPAVALAGMAALASCGDAARSDVALLVAAASDLAAALPELVDAFEAETGTVVRVTYGSSGLLARQILHGAPVDVFLSADEHWVDELAAADRIEPGARVVYAFGRLVLLAGRIQQPPPDVRSLSDAVYSRIGLANPEHAPYGRAAKQALERADVDATGGDRLIPVENVRQTLQVAETGAVDVAISAMALMHPERHRWTVVPASMHEPLSQTAVVIAGRPQTRPAAAFVAFLRGPYGREVLARYGFDLP